MSNYILELPDSPTRLSTISSTSHGCGEIGSLPRLQPAQAYHESRLPSSTGVSRPTGDGVTARYGPRSLPLFYTALQQMPDRLVLKGHAEPGSYRLTVGLPEVGGRIVPLMTALSEDEVCPTWLLAGLPANRATLYAWRVEPAAARKQQSTEDITIGAAPKSAPIIQEGRFWLLDPERTARLEHGRSRLAQGADPDFVLIAQALLMAELGLYHDALLEVKKPASQTVRPARALLGHIAQSLIYKQMALHLEQAETQWEMAGAIPAGFCIWARNREEYHRQQSSAQMQSGAGERSPQRAAPMLGSRARVATTSLRVAV